MATIVLQAAGAALGGVFGAAGAALGTAAGALAGYALDRALLSPAQKVEGPRLAAQKLTTAEDGASLPRVYGAARVGGTLIWATRFEEKRETRRGGGKASRGPEVSEYSYFANAAFALCEGPVAGIRRVWADGVELDRERVDLRFWTGSENQEADALIALKQGDGNAPAYRGTAYAVLERLPVGQFGNRLPQLQFEVLRPVGLLHERVRGVALIRGSTEYGLAPYLVSREERPGEAEAVNRHVFHAGTDIEASLDELQALCPRIEHVALVVSWFGDDLRASHCRIRPGVTDRAARGFEEAWRVAGVERGDAFAVSRHGAGSAYGGTPTDASVKAAIAALKARGLKVTLYPFVMMDVAPGNGLPDPYGGAEQAAYPWRGRITVSPAPGRTGTPDKTAGARAAVEAFCAGEGYRRLVLHYAQLASEAGGVDAFLIGSELRGLSTLRDEAGAFPFVEELCRLAGECRAALGAATAITYGADWSEYFGYHPADGSGDVLFHLDPLWAHPAVSAVGIDAYMPLSDWRDGDGAGGHPDGARGPADPQALRAAIAGGEGFDWFYPTEEDRAARRRFPITDGAYGKPWMFRFKDLVRWWSHPHHDRHGGVERAEPTGWVPAGKPIWLTELGCPAADKGANQPNVFPDQKSAESAAPYGSNGGRSDLVQRRFLEAHLRWWDENDDGFAEEANPVSPVYGGRMVDRSRIYLWAWDARPFPAFPLRGDFWGDGANWQNGHWLNGRIEAPAVGDLVNAILRDHGLDPAAVGDVPGSVAGYLAEPGSARAALEPLVEAFGLQATVAADGLRFGGGAGLARVIESGSLVLREGEGSVTLRREPEGDLPAEVLFGYRNALNEYQGFSSRAVWPGAVGRRQASVSLPAVLEPGAGDALAAEWLRRQWSDREEVRFALAPHPTVEPGEVIACSDILNGARLVVVSVDSGLVQEVTARRAQPLLPEPWRGEGQVPAPPAPTVLPLAGAPHMLLLDLPRMGREGGEEGLQVALHQRPWRQQVLYASPEDTGFERRASVEHPAMVGRLASALAPSEASGRMLPEAALTVELFGGEASGVSALRLLNGANAAAVRSDAGTWEVLQFRHADEVEAGRFRLSGLLRGQLGTEDAMGAGASVGADMVLLDDALQPAGLRASERGLPLRWRAVPGGADLSGRHAAQETASGGLRALTPLAPVHLGVRPNETGLRFSWVRRSRVDADGWEAGEVPLGEDFESYRAELLAGDGTLLAEAEPAAPFWDWVPAAGHSHVTLRVRQHGTGVAWGLPAEKSFDLSRWVS